MSDTDHPIEWYLARDGKQHGPISDIEMRKVVEGGHLKPTDLVWRQGFAEWMAVGTVFPSARAPRPAAPPRPSPAPQPDQRAAAAPAPGPQPAPARQAPMPAAAATPVASPAHPTASVMPPRGQPAAPAPAAAPMQPARHQALDAAAAAMQPGAHGATVPAPAAPHPQAPRSPQHPQPVMPSPHPAAGTPVGYPASPTAPAIQPRAPQPHLQAQPGQAPQPMARMPRPGGGPVDLNAMRTNDPWRAADGAGAGAPYPGPAMQMPMPARPLQAEPPAGEFEDEEPPRRRLPWRLAIGLLVLAMLGGASLALYKTDRLKLSSLPFLSGGAKQDVPVVKASRETVKEPVAGSAAVASAPPAGAPDEIDTGLQKSQLWKLLKKEFPEWYAARLDEVAKLRSAKSSEREVEKALMQALVDLRRKNSSQALSSSVGRLRSVASTFLDNLTKLAAQSTDACYAFISQGETSPAVLDMLRPGDPGGPLQAQFAAIFEAVAEGRKSPQLYEQAKREDYDKLTSQLQERGWKVNDLQTFSDARALAQAPPERVCQMVQDWFKAQLAVQDDPAQARLLIEALKPVVAG